LNIPFYGFEIDRCVHEVPFRWFVLKKC